MLSIEVTNEVKSRTTKTFTFRNQVAYVALPGAKYPSLIYIPLRRNDEPYPAGKYIVSPESFRLDVQYGEPRLSFELVILPAPVSVRSAG